MPQELEITTAGTNIELPDPTPNIPNPKPLKQYEIEWIILTPDTLPEGSDWVFISMTPKHYENLAKNQADILRFIKEANWQLRYYRQELPGDNTDGQ